MNINANTDKVFKRKLALERGKRVKLIRTLANLTRKEMFEKYSINPNTTHAWEKGTNLLTEKKAINLVEVFNQEGIAVTKEWLLYGENPESINKSNLDDKTQDLKDIIHIKGDLKILDEVNYFRHNNLNSVSAMISDEALFPLFCVGDYVGGVNTIGKSLNELVGEFCIITTKDGRVLIKKILSYKGKNDFLVGGINPFANLNDPHYFTCTIQSAATITRHWCLGMISKRPETLKS